MKRKTEVKVEQFYQQHGPSLQMRLVAGANGLGRTIGEPTVNRPGLALAGFTKYFAQHRVQVMGNAEMHFLKSLPPSLRQARYRMLFRFRIPCVVFCREYQPGDLFLACANEAGVPVFRCPWVTMRFINQATLRLEAMFAPQSLEMGSMVDIHGMGVIIRGESGIGKSECVLALIERGYSLVSDDMTRVRLFEGREIIGTSPEVTRNHMEVRGIGIIDVPAMFGIRSIRASKRVDLVITLKAWESVSDVDRVGMEQETVPMLGIEIPHITIPVRPGRDIARLVEVAAFHARLKVVGYNPAQELNQRLIAKMTGEEGD